ncbi:centriolar satellite-associated tubulin polyglutamylase complex regulator 1 isoform X2 [Vidua macroura]|uniref:centriolar satellite-associated tubulin polyglutamylase complex regulator 1 isoform X2 n=1 Tax=Vidua macroura TaxID=187451 RepID=UPI0023A80E97|nr:centriolar satellite-associated tubulin polyglutamylase complex regulator 1 isoform X2 [Vidua macroura]
MALPGSSLNILTACGKEHTSCSVSSALSKPPLITGRLFFGPSGGVSELWGKMELRGKSDRTALVGTSLGSNHHKEVSKLWSPDLLTTQEYHCLLQLLCPDFPMELTQKAARIVLMDDAVDCLMSFSDFLFAFQIQFYYSEFLESVAAIYQDLLAGKSPNTVIVPTSSSGQHRQRQPPNDCNPLEGVEASVFYQCLESLCDRSKYSCPPSALVKEMLSSVQRMTFYGFLMALAKDQGINRALGALPDKGDLLLDPVMDQEIEKLVAQVSGLSVSGPASSSADTANMLVRNSPRINSPWKPLHHRRKMDAESEGSNEETDSSEN